MLRLISATSQGEFILVRYAVTRTGGGEMPGGLFPPL